MYNLPVLRSIAIILDQTEIEINYIDPPLRDHIILCSTESRHRFLITDTDSETEKERKKVLVPTVMSEFFKSPIDMGV